MPVVRINTFQAKPGRAAELREFLSSTLDLIHGLPGCRSVELLASADDADRFAIAETWDSVEAHNAATARIPPELLKRAMALLASPPKGTWLAQSESQFKDHR
jgi:heme-degrading monooxygenase HmoA